MTDRSIYYSKSIYYKNSKSETKVLIETCTFYDIFTTSGDGATVYFSGLIQIVHNKVCSTKSQLNTNSNNFGIYSYHEVTHNETSKNYVIESSFTQCSSEFGGETFNHYYGDVQCNKNNISRTDTKLGPCPYFSSINKAANISFSSFNNNTGHSRNWYCFYHYGDFEYFYSYCDILYNENSAAILYFGSNCNFSSCNIFDNVDNDTNCLFYMNDDSYKLTTSNCYIKNEKANKNYPESLTLNTVEISNYIQFISVKCKRNESLQQVEIYCQCSCKAHYFHISTMESFIPVAVK